MSQSPSFGNVDRIEALGIAPLARESTDMSLFDGGATTVAVKLEFDDESDASDKSSRLEEAGDGIW